METFGHLTDPAPRAMQTATDATRSSIGAVGRTHADLGIPSPAPLREMTRGMQIFDVVNGLDDFVTGTPKEAKEGAGRAVNAASDMLIPLAAEAALPGSGPFVGQAMSSGKQVADLMLRHGLIGTIGDFFDKPGDAFIDVAELALGWISPHLSPPRALENNGPSDFGAPAGPAAAPADDWCFGEPAPEAETEAGWSAGEPVAQPSAAPVPGPTRFGHAPTNAARRASSTALENVEHRRNRRR